MILSELRKIVCETNRALPTHRLVTMTSGNASGRDSETGYIVVKPSGVSFDDLTPEQMVIVDDRCNVIDESLKPSVDALTHCYIYRHRPDVFSIIHTYSNDATSFAALGQPIPCAPYCQIGEEQIGASVVEHIGTSCAILLQSHGVFTIGKDCKSALKAAVMCEDVAKTVHLAMLKGNPILIPEDEIRRGYRRYQEKYGQK